MVFYKYLKKKNLENMAKLLGEHYDFKQQKVFHLVTLYQPTLDHQSNKFQNMQFIKPCFSRQQDNTIIRFVHDFFRSYCDHIITTSISLRNENSLGTNGLETYQDHDQELIKLSYKVNQKQFEYSNHYDYVHKDFHLLLKDKHDLKQFRKQFKLLSHNPHIHFHYFMPDKFTVNYSQSSTVPKQTENTSQIQQYSQQMMDTVQQYLQQQKQNEKGLMLKDGSIDYLDNENPYLYQMVERCLQSIHLRNINNVRQGSKKVLIEVGSNANFIYEKNYKINNKDIVDQLIIVLVTGPVPSQHLGRKFVSLEKILNNYELANKSYTFRMAGKQTVKVLRFEKKISAKEKAQIYYNNNKDSFKDLFI